MTIPGSNKAVASQPGRIVAFKLDGKATLARDPGPLPRHNPTGTSWPAATTAEGDRLYGAYCFRCHGVLARASNVIPDLRRSGMLTDKDAWRSVVIDGAPTDCGMISWQHVMSARQAEAIRAYVDDAARKAKAGGTR